MVRKKFKLKNHEILLVETLIFHNSRTKIFPDIRFCNFFKLGFTPYKAERGTELQEKEAQKD